MRISLEPLTDENGFTPEQVREIREALRESEEEFDTLPVYPNMDAFIAHLRNIE